MFVFKDESEAQRQPLNFPTHNGINFGRSLFLLSLLLPRCLRILRARSAFERNKETFSLAKLVRFLQIRDDERMREREKKRDEKKNTNRERSNRVRLPGPPLSISRHKCYKYYSLLSLTDKPAGAGDANLQLLLRPVRLGAVDPSQGVLLARGVRSFRISHSFCVIVSRCVVEDVCVLWGQKEEKKERVSLNGRREHFYDRLKKVVEKHLFFLYFEKLFIYRERIRREKKFFHLFFWCASFSRTLLSLLSLSFLSFFSLVSLKLVSSSLPSPPLLLNSCIFFLSVYSIRISN